MNGDLYHSGVGHQDDPPGRGSGRYPWGSGKRPMQRIRRKDELKSVDISRNESNTSNKKKLKKYQDRVLDAKKDTLSTLTWNKDRLKNTDMFFAAFDKTDKYKYMTSFSKSKKVKEVDEKGRTKTKKIHKTKLVSKLSKNIKVAGEDSAAKVFIDLYDKDNSLRNFVLDPKRMETLAGNRKYLFRGYREGLRALKRVREAPDKASNEDLRKVYRFFNFVLPNNGGGNKRVANDVLSQRTKFINELKKQGYSATIDTNDALYGGYKANAPIIVFDMDAVAETIAKEVSDNERNRARWIYAGRHALGI